MNLTTPRVEKASRGSKTSTGKSEPQPRMSTSFLSDQEVRPSELVDYVVILVNNNGYSSRPWPDSSRVRYRDALETICAAICHLHNAIFDRTTQMNPQVGLDSCMAWQDRARLTAWETLLKNVGIPDADQGTVNQWRRCLFEAAVHLLHVTWVEMDLRMPEQTTRQ